MEAYFMQSLVWKPELLSPFMFAVKRSLLFEVDLWPYSVSLSLPDLIMFFFMVNLEAFITKVIRSWALPRGHTVYQCKKLKWTNSYPGRFLHFAPTYKNLLLFY